MWSYETEIFDYLISKVCYLIAASSLLKLSISLSLSLSLSRSFALSVGVGALDLDGDTRPSALRMSHTASLKRGGSLRTPRPSSEYLFSELVFGYKNALYCMAGIHSILYGLYFC